jgi:hypothetical protein
MRANPALRPLKMVGDLGVASRLVLLVEMTVPNPDGTEGLYCRQAFYLSTGTSSDFPNTWLPFDGLVYGVPQEIGRGVLAPPTDPHYDPPPPEGYEVVNKLWVNKDAFLNPTLNDWNTDSYPEETYAVRSLFRGGFLPEPYSDRSGNFSHMIASYLLGGGRWNVRGPDNTFPYMAGGAGQPSYYVNIHLLDDILRRPRPLDPAFHILRDDATILGFSSSQEINAYIERFDAISYMNGFVALGIALPKPSELSVNVTYRDVQITLPLFYLVNQLRSILHVVFMSWKTGEIAGDPATITAVATAAISRNIGKTGYGSRGGLWNVIEHLDRIRFIINPAQEGVRGGRRKKRKTVRRKARKGKSLRRRR